MSHATHFHTSVAVQQWKLLQSLLKSESSAIELDGSSLDIPHVVWIARYAGKARLNASVKQSLEKSNDALQSRLANGEIIYGVNTGFGASADMRPKHLDVLQRTLMRELSYGVLPQGPRDPQAPVSNGLSNEVSNGLPNGLSNGLSNGLTNGEHSSVASFDSTAEDILEAQHMPWTWVRAALLLRTNNLVKGYSGVRPVIAETLADLLTHDIVPMIPLRGSISASGDLSPLAYFSGTVMGKTTIRVRTKEGVVYADQALAKAGITPIKLQAKEGLAIVNGTAMSAASAIHGLHDAHQLAMLSQVFTAMCVEALLGTPESFHPFFGETRPHPGQIESARNILAFLQDSKLAKVSDGVDGSLRQDRYSIRTAAQWIGPSIEDLLLAHNQLKVECNSVTDNPLIDQEGNSLHGGNFQAKAVTSATEKIRTGLQTIGRLLYTQIMELINHTTNRGLSPNLIAEEPNQSTIFKAIDVYTSALFPELSFLSGPVNHVQNAEMGNQSLNSLALISSRYTATSIRILSELTAAHMLTVCQALDLRAMQLRFLDACSPQISQAIETILLQGLSTPEQIAAAASFKEAIWAHFLKTLDSTVTLESEVRFRHIARTSRVPLLEHPAFHYIVDPLPTLQKFVDALGPMLHDTWVLNRDAYMLQGDASEYLGKASKIMYAFIRRTLGVPFLCSPRMITPEPERLLPEAEEYWGDYKRRAGEAPTIGSYTGVVYRAIRDGRFMPVMLEVLEVCLPSKELVS